MFTRTLIAAATAAVIGAATLGAATTSASAAGVTGYGPGPNGPNMFYKPAPDQGYPSGQFRSDRYKPFPQWPVKPVVQKVCGPTFKQVIVWKVSQGWVWQKVYAGQSCRLEKIYPTMGPHWR